MAKGLFVLTGVNLSSCVHCHLVYTSVHICYMLYMLYVLCYICMCYKRFILFVESGEQTSPERE